MHTCRMREERSLVTNRLVVEEHSLTWLYRPFRSSSSHAACLCSSTYAAWLSLPVVETIVIPFRVNRTSQLPGWVLRRWQDP